MAAILHGPLSSTAYQLAKANRAGCGVFATVNETESPAQASMAAGTGRLLADWMTHRKPQIDVEGLTIERYL